MGAVRKLDAKKRGKKKEYERVVENILKEYPIMKAAVQDASKLLPSCVSSYGERIQGFSEYRSSTEKFAILRTIRTKESRVKQIEKALNQLTEEEQRLIELRYFDRLPMLRVCFLLAMSETTYKRRRKSALRKIARIMNFI